MTTDQTGPSVTERRHVVEGHKNGQNFREVSACYRPIDDCMGYYQARIDNPPKEAWQPTIVRVIHETRCVEPWAAVSRKGSSSSSKAP